MVAYTFRMPYGIPGDITRQSLATVEAQALNSSLPFPGYGLFGKLASNLFVPIAGGDTPSSIYGLLVRPFPTTGANASDPLGTSVPRTTGICNVLRRGYANVMNNAGTPAAGGIVYVRTANPSGAKVVGGCEAALEWGSSVAAKAGITGNGTAVLDATTPVLANAMAGVYTLVCTVAGTNSATWRLSDPKGDVLADVSYSGAGATATFANQIKIVITDGTTDFVVGDQFNVTVVGNTIAVPNCYFTAAADANGNAEIAYNI